MEARMQRGVYMVGFTVLDTVLDRIGGPEAFKGLLNIQMSNAIRDRRLGGGYITIEHLPKRPDVPDRHQFLITALRPEMLNQLGALLLDWDLTEDVDIGWLADLQTGGNA